MTNLQKDVRRLQQAITDLTHVLDSGITGKERTAAAGQLAALERELDQQQRALARLQDRI